MIQMFAFPHPVLQTSTVLYMANCVRHGRYITFQLAEAAVPRARFADIWRRIGRLGPRVAPA